MSHCTENHNMDLTAWYKSQKLIILGKHYFVIHYIFWSKSEAIWDVMLSHHFLITLQYLFNIRLHIIIVSRGREPPFGLLNEDCLVERVGGQVFLLDHKVVANELAAAFSLNFAASGVPLERSWVLLKLDFLVANSVALLFSSRYFATLCLTLSLSFSLIFLSNILLFKKRTYTKDSSWIGMVLYFSVPKRKNI